MYLPWSRVSDFRCYACGLCCYRFQIPLKPQEALSIERLFGPGYVTSVAGKLYIRKEEGGPCPFLVERNGKLVCHLQDLGLKPKACKLWPFRIYHKPEYGRAEEAYFSHRLGSFYVYVDQRCPGIKLGRPKPRLIKTIEEAVEIWLGARSNQLLTTAILRPFQGFSFLLKNDTKNLLSATY